MNEKEIDDVEMEEDDDSEDGDSGSEEGSGDSDKELQIAFEKGLIKPGLFKVEEKKEHVNDPAGLKAALASFEMKNKLEWAERLDVTCEPVLDATGLSTGENDATENTPDARDKDAVVHNDFQREMTIHRQAQGAWLEALHKLKKLGIPTKRPDDYFAQMVKADFHMKKVREKILNKQLSMEQSEKMRKLRELKKYGKKVQQEVLLKRQKEKKNLAESVKKYRKGVQDKLDFMNNDDFGGIEAEDKLKQKKNKGQNNSNTFNNKKINQPNRKRIEKNKKFGHGGQKKRSKYNTAESSADVFGGSKKGGGGRGGGKSGKGGGRGGGKAGKNVRPGKSKRAQNKNKKR